MTLALAIFRQFPAVKIVPYRIAQVAGGFAGAALVYVFFGPAIDHFNTLQAAVNSATAGPAERPAPADSHVPVGAR